MVAVREPHLLKSFTQSRATMAHFEANEQAKARQSSENGLQHTLLAKSWSL